MPVSKIESTGRGKIWGIWRIDESEPALSTATQETCPGEITNPQKRLEWLAGRVLIQLLAEKLQVAYHGLRKDEFGKPFLNQHRHQISLSHSFPYVAAQIDEHRPVGIDIEQPKEKLRKIAHRVFSKEEVVDANHDVVKLCIYWCAKEALYKIYGKRNLLFTDHLLVRPFVLADTGDLSGIIRFAGSESAVNLRYLVTTEFVMVYTAG